MKHNIYHGPITLTKYRFKTSSEVFIGTMEFIYRTIFHIYFLFGGGPLHALNEHSLDKADRFSLTANLIFFRRAWLSASAGPFILAISHEDRAMQGCNSSACESRMAGRRRTPFFVAVPFLCNGSRSLFNLQRYWPNCGSGQARTDIE